ncbi:hypothetical protein OL548_33900 (plasmid) [Lysinibacillus sp. MHQ-1]|nr:hypothetical protein OL548_33900 [Lysinibacillus sp. MHQ-1]
MGKCVEDTFLLDFNKVDSKDRASKIYELDLYSFYLLISEICSAKQDIENDIENEEAKTYLTHMENVITEFIKNYHNLCRMKEIIKKIIKYINEERIFCELIFQLNHLGDIFLHEIILLFCMLISFIIRMFKTGQKICKQRVKRLIFFNSKREIIIIQ